MNFNQKKGTYKVNRISGRGADKYLAALSLSNTSYLFADGYFPSPKSIQPFERYVKNNELLLSIRKKIIRAYEDRINPIIYDLMLADIVGVTNHGKQYLFRHELLDIINGVKILSEDTYLNLFEQDTMHVGIDNLLVNSSYINYINYLIDKTIIEFRLKNRRLNYSVNDIYSLLKENYKGILMEKLITAYLFYPHRRYPEENSNLDFYKCLDDAFKVVKDIELKNMLKTKKDRYGIGSIAYNFNLTDNNDNRVKLEDFKGKVVLIDVYATICSSCRQFGKTLKEEIIPEFKNNPDVVFVAISIEKNKDIWLKDLGREHNASPESEICLWTEGKGSKHPFVEYYQIKAIPVLLLLDKEGKILNSSQNTLNSRVSGEEVIRMINEALESS